MKASISLGAALAGIAFASPVWQDTSSYVRETHPVPRQFTWESDAPQDHMLQLSIALKQSRFEELDRLLYEVSDPDHHSYGQHLSASEVEALVKPSDEALSLVHAWLAEHDINLASIDYSPASDILTFAVPVWQVERMLDTKYSVYRHADGSSLVRTPDWAVPKHLFEHIDTVQPTNSFMRPRRQATLVTKLSYTEIDDTVAESPLVSGQSVSQVCKKGSVTPLCLRTLYGTVNYTTKAGSKNQVALNDFLGEFNNRSDATLFLEKFRPTAVAGAKNFKQVSVQGGPTQQKPATPSQLNAGVGIEGGLDVQTILGIAYPVPLTTYSTGGMPPEVPDSLSPVPENEPYLGWINYALKLDFIPQVVSNSYEDDEQTVPLSFARRVCQGFAQLGARGVTVVFGSGDGGVEGVQVGGNCTSNRTGKKEFIPLFPSSCPYVTSVGATVNFAPEVVAFDPANGFVSGGGFSNYFPQPSYQTSVVEGYLAKFGSEYSNLYNKTGRAYPDIAAYGVNYTINYGGSFYNVDGTSASTPTAASVFTLINDALIAKGESPLGFLNPWLYKYGYEAFTDVTSGNTKGCNTTGFTAMKGWDPASGFGTPNFGKLLSIVGCD